jgi:enoyl-CoA hydratase/carnithine racemase
MQVALDVQGPLATLTLDDQARKNAMSPELGDLLRARTEELRGLSTVRVVILRGAGGTFSGGGDLAMLNHLRTLSAEAAREFMLGFYARYLSVISLPIPVIASVEGAAIGAGFAVALACDLMVVDAEAKLALNFAKLGLYPGMGSSHTLPLRAGRQRATELLLSGRRFSGAEAAHWGIALEAAPKELLADCTHRIAADIAGSSPLVIRALLKRLRTPAAQLQQALYDEATEQAQSYGSADFAEGIAAQIARRTPIFDRT